MSERPPESTRWVGGADQPVGGLTAWDGVRKAAETIRQYGANRRIDILTYLSDAFIKRLLQVQPCIKPIGATLYVKVLWDGFNGEPEPVRLSHRMQRRIRHFERHRHLCRQFFPKRARY
jgi:hypothetical protein